MPKSGELSQSLLSFGKPQAIKPSRLPSRDTDREPVSQLPGEIWLLIMSCSSTTTLKALRLTCRSAACAATPILFETAYLDSFNGSWRRFVKLAMSPFAELVRTIVWTPLYMDKKCLDADAWITAYAELLEGVTQVERVSLHRAFRRVFNRVHKENWDWDTTTLDFSSLVNCQTIILRDDLDIKTRSTDKALRERLRNDEELLAQPATWGLSPRSCPLREHNRYEDESLQSSYQVFELMNKIPTISRVFLSMRADNELPVLSYARTYPYITHVDIALRHFHFWDVSTGRHKLSWVLRTMFNWLTSLTELERVSLQTVYTNPDPESMKIYRSRRAEELADPDSETDDDSLASSVSSIKSRISQIDYKFTWIPNGLTRNHLDAVHAEILFPMGRMRRLRTLELQNVSFSAQNLIAWLCNHDPVPTRGITLKLSGNIVVVGLSAPALVRMLSRLNVSIVCEQTAIVYYQTDETDPMSYIPRLSTAWYAGNDRSDHSPSYWYTTVLWEWPSHEDDLEAYLYEGHPSFSLFDDFNLVIDRPEIEVNISERPHYVSDILPNFETTADEDLTLLYYCSINTEKMDLYWIDKRSYSGDLKDNGHVLLKARCRRHRGAWIIDDGRSDDFYH